MENFVFITNKEELKETLREVFREFMTEKPVEQDFSDKMTRRQAAKFLGVSYTTMYNWLKDGILTEHGPARKKWFLKKELIAAIVEKSTIKIQKNNETY